METMANFGPVTLFQASLPQGVDNMRTETEGVGEDTVCCVGSPRVEKLGTDIEMMTRGLATTKPFEFWSNTEALGSLTLCADWL